MTKFKEKHSRTIAKVVSWRVLLTTSHVINGVIATGSWLTGFQIAGLAAVLNSLLFWAHERGWNWAQWNRKPTNKKLFVDGQPRTISKIITWRAVITFSNFIIPFIITGSWGQAALFTGLATIINVALFYTHERVWNKFSWGKLASA